MNIIEASAIVGIAPPFSTASLRKAYRKASMIHHPDTGGSEESFILLQDAYKFLVPLVKEDVVDDGDRDRDDDLVTVEGAKLSSLGKGFPLNKNACECSQCGGRGYTERVVEPRKIFKCRKCGGHGIISHPCKYCNGQGKAVSHGKVQGECRYCKGTGKFFPLGNVKTDRNGNKFVDGPRGSIEIKRSELDPKIMGRICFECSGTGEGFGMMFGFMFNLDLIQEERKSRIVRNKCYTCHGIGEIEMFNPVLPRGLFANGRK